MFECEAEIVGHREVVPGTFLMIIDAPSISRTARPGRFVMIRAGSGFDPLLRRPFSICGLFADEAIGVLFKVVGRGTALLAQKRCGDKVHVLGPLGNGFSTDDISLPLLLVGGGIGVAPLFFLAQTLYASGDHRFRMLTGFSKKVQILSAREVLHLEVEAEFATDDGSMGHNGFVTELLQGILGTEHGSRSFGGIYACGPISMLKRVAAIARFADIPCQVSLEAYMACGLGACQGCVVQTVPEEPVPFLRVCTEGPVFSAQAVDWTPASTY